MKVSDEFNGNEKKCVNSNVQVNQIYKSTSRFLTRNSVLDLYLLYVLTPLKIL